MKHFFSIKQRWVLSDYAIERFFLFKEKHTQPLYGKQYLFIVQYIVMPYIFLKVFVRVAYYYIKQFRFNLTHNSKTVKLIVLSSGRNYSVNNIRKLFEIDNDNDKYILINSFIMEDYMRNGRVTMRIMLNNLLASFREFYSVLPHVKYKVVLHLLLKNGASNISIYVYLRSFFQQVGSLYNGIGVYSEGALLSSHASISSGLKTIYFTHGLREMVYLDCFPEYDRIYLYSKDEKSYLKKIGIKSKISIYPISKLKFHNNNVIFFMPSFASDDYFNWKETKIFFSNLVQIFKEFDYGVYIKVHPLAKSSNKFSKEYGLQSYNWSKIFDLSCFEYIDGLDGESVINKVNPSFVVGWGSTALCESLNMGVIPITMWDTRWNETESIFPINRRALLWPSEMKMVKDLLKEKTSYNNVLNMLRNR